MELVIESYVGDGLIGEICGKACMVEDGAGVLFCGDDGLDVDEVAAGVEGEAEFAGEVVAIEGVDVDEAAIAD